MISVTVSNMILQLEEDSLCFSFQKGEQIWKWRKGCRPRIVYEDQTVYFSDAKVIRHEIYSFGLGSGIRSHYEGFQMKGKQSELSFDTQVWIETVSGDVYCEWIPLKEEPHGIEAVFWPGEMEFEERRESWYTLINHQQGLLIPNTWETKLQPLAFHGFFGTAGSYMPWISQIRERDGYIAICLTPWNAGCEAEHPAGGPYTHVGIRFEPSLGRMDYRRIVRYSFLEDCDYNHICKVYRRFVQEQGQLCTLKEKAARTPSVDRLIGCAFVHKGIKTHVQEKSDFYNAENPEENNSLTTFQERESEMRNYHSLGVEKLYLHLDGWAEPGYDNNHPDYYPACEAAGGWEGMRSLSNTMHELGYLFGIHDQYRDYYLTAASFDEHYACRLTDGSIPRHQRWAGGPQSYLCATMAPHYVKRNFSMLKEEGIHLDGTYLDVFTCNEGDECTNPYHRMTRRECYEYRKACFDYLLAEGILPSSEEVSDWAVKSLVFCHYAPYDFMLMEPGHPKNGIPVPLFNLVYHDCVIEPWMMDRVSESEDYMLFALLNGGAPYLQRDGAYPDFDGAFNGNMELKLRESISRCRVVSSLHEKVAKCEMISHEMKGRNYEIHKSTFSDGTVVTVDFKKQQYNIQYGEADELQPARQDY